MFFPIAPYESGLVKVNCEHPRIIINRRYTSDKSPFRLPHHRFSDNWDYYLQVPCGLCRLCKAKLANEWKVRLEFELRSTRLHRHLGQMLPRAIFTTLTIAPEHYTDDERYFADYFVKFRDNYRKRFGISPRYFAITDRGSQYARLHIHMLLFDPRYYDKKTKTYGNDVWLSTLVNLKFWWPYGQVRRTEYVKSFGAGSYVSGYISGANLANDEPVKHGKLICEKALQYKPRVFVSNGLGKSALQDPELVNRMREDNIVQLGEYIYGLPRYYRNSIFSAHERYWQLFLRQVDYSLTLSDLARNPSKEYYYRNMHLSKSSLSKFIDDGLRWLTPSPSKPPPSSDIPPHWGFYPWWHNFENATYRFPISKDYSYYNNSDWLSDNAFIFNQQQNCPF